MRSTEFAQRAKPISDFQEAISQTADALFPERKKVKDAFITSEADVDLRLVAHVSLVADSQRGLT